MNSLRYNTNNNLKLFNYHLGGMGMIGRNYQTGSESYRYSINGQEVESELNKNITTALFWEYDSRIGKRWNVDPLSYKFPSESPYCAMENNPVYNIDPDGMEAKDWFKDKKGIMQYDPKVKSQKDLGERGTYVGETKTEFSNRGSKVEFRKDGSILFSNENDAYDRMKQVGSSREAMAVHLKTKTLYLPDYNNNLSTSETESLGYTLKGNQITDPIIGQAHTFSASIHTHFSLINGSSYGDDNPSFSDIYYFSKKSSNIPFITIGVKTTYGYFGKWESRSDGKYYTTDVKYTQFMRIPSSKIYSGLRSSINKNRSKYGNF